MKSGAADDGGNGKGKTTVAVIAGVRQRHYQLGGCSRDDDGIGSNGGNEQFNGCGSSSRDEDNGRNGGDNGDNISSDGSGGNGIASTAAAVVEAVVAVEASMKQHQQ